MSFNNIRTFHVENQNCKRYSQPKYLSLSEELMYGLRTLYELKGQFASSKWGWSSGLCVRNVDSLELLFLLHVIIAFIVLAVLDKKYNDSLSMRGRRTNRNFGHLSFSLYFLRVGTGVGQIRKCSPFSRLVTVIGTYVVTNLARISV